MFHEVVNGFSVVFTNAILKTNLKKRRDLNYNFKKAGNLNKLIAFNINKSQKIIKVLC